MEQNRKAEEYDKLVESNRRLRNQVISLQANVKNKKNKIKQMKRKGKYHVWCDSWNVSTCRMVMLT